MNKIQYKIKMKVPVEVSARHVHLSRKDCDMLFGKDYQIEKFKDVSQPGQFASVETLQLIGPKQSIENVRIIAPVRDETQVEISMTDVYTLGIEMPKVLASGELENSTGGIELIGPKGKTSIDKGIIISQRHLHIEPELAKKENLKHGDIVSIFVDGERSVVFNNVLVRSREGKDKLSFQIDTDEGNACGISGETYGYLLDE